jgi:hypothetical protein
MRSLARNRLTAKGKIAHPRHTHNCGILPHAKEAKMNAETTPTPPGEKQIKMSYHTSSDAVYSIGMIGAMVYYFKRATTPQERVTAFLKGLVWPGFLVYELFKFLEKE